MLNGTIQRLVFICVFQLNKLRLSRHIVCRGISELEGGRDLFFLPFIMSWEHRQVDS